MSDATVCRVPGCGQPAGQGSFVCSLCMSEHVERLAEIPLLAHALDDRFLRLQRFSVCGVTYRAPDGDSRREEESPVPFDRRAGDLRREIRRWLLRWYLAVDRREPRRWHPPLTVGHVPSVPATVEAMTAHLLAHAHLFSEWSEAVTELRALHKRGFAAVDRPPDLVYLGICSMRVGDEECPEDLYAEWGKAHARCRGCKYQHDVKSRQSVLLSAVRDQLATASDVSRGLSGLDIKVSAERIRKWKERGRIAPHGQTLREHPLYRVGDVIDLVLSERERLRDELRKNTPTKRKANA